MKKISKAEQKKMYEMFEDALNRKTGLLIQALYSFGQSPNVEKMWEEAEEEKKIFLSKLESDIEVSVCLKKQKEKEKWLNKTTEC
jgi:hypothetical protein